MSLVSDTLSAAAFGIDSNALATAVSDDEEDADEGAPLMDTMKDVMSRVISTAMLPVYKFKVVCRLSHMAFVFSMSYSFMWDKHAQAVVMVGRDAARDAAAESAADSMRDWRNTRSMFVDTIANRIDLPTHHIALIKLGQSLRATYKKIVKHMRKVKAAEEAAAEDGHDSGSGGPGGSGGPTPCGFSKMSPMMMMRQLQDVAARRLVEEMLWWMSRPSVLDAMCASTHDSTGATKKVVPTEEVDQWKFLRRARTFKAMVPLVHEQMRDFGLRRIGRVAAIETRAQLQKARTAAKSAATDADGDDSGGVSVSTAEPPSVSRMMAAVVSVAYESNVLVETVRNVDGDDGTSTEQSFFSTRAQFMANNMLRPLVKINMDDLADAIAKPYSVDRPADVVDCQFAERLTAPNSVFSVAYDMRYPEYELGPHKIVAQIVRDLLLAIAAATLSSGDDDSVSA